jgi:hypothetical protein
MINNQEETMKPRTVERMERAIKCQEYWVNEAHKADAAEQQLNISMNAGISLKLGLTPDQYEQARRKSLQLLRRMVDCMMRAHICYRYLTNQACKNDRDAG